MKNIIYLSIFLICLLPTVVNAQEQHTRKALASPAQIQASEGYLPKLGPKASPFADNVIPTSKEIRKSTVPSPSSGKVSTLLPFQLGTSSNAFSALRCEQNQVAVDNATDAVAFIHCQNVNIWGGGSTEKGKYRYDISIDNGTTFTNDIGPLQSIYTNYGRYPNCAFFNENGTNNPLSEKLVYAGPTDRFPTPGWVGQVNGISSVTTSNPVSSTDNYQFDGQNTFIPGGLCQGLPGEFWTVEFSHDGTNIQDSIRIYKGTYNTGTQDVDWVRHGVINPGYDKSFDGSIAAVGPNIAFSPNGMTGYIGIVANVLAGTNTNNEAMMPVFFKTTDGGATWGSAIEVDLDAIPWLADTLQTLWVDGNGDPISDGRACASFDYDIAVDANGNVHMGVVLGTSSGGFAISAGLAKCMVDVWTPDGGTTWDATFLSPVLTFRGTFGSGMTQLVSENHCQVARDEAGDHLYFTWIDSDTSAVTGTQTGIGFGQFVNTAPNLRMVAKDVTNHTQTYPKLLTDGDLLWSGIALNPTLAPIVVENGTIHELPLVMLNMVQNDPSLETEFWYFGKELTVDVSDPSIWCHQPLMQLGWTQISTPGFVPVCAVGVDPSDGPNDHALHDWFPNPTNGNSQVNFELASSNIVNIVLMDQLGRQILTLSDGEFKAGLHSVGLSTSKMAPGIYYTIMQVDGKIYSNKLLITK